ncbi:hypothetical protein [Adlercreutzia mucosicola]|nr:hypothetical protein [Adlercreutzia mucosicola]MEB1814413.1 hypothetical protein [Adlercreutzia mucosicola]
MAASVASSADWRHTTASFGFAGCTGCARLRFFDMPSHLLRK